jgi:peptide/nickel transport system permease protein
MAVKAVKKINGFFDIVADKLSLLVYAMPSFVIGVFLILIFSVQLDLLPTSGVKSLNNSELSFLSRILDYVAHLILPLITLTAGGIAVFYRYLRDNINEIYNHSFIINLRSMGYDEKTILRKHVFPNTLGPFISIAGVELGILFGGALITEVIFGLPGMGRLTISAIFERDYPLVIGCAFTAAFLMILSNFIADLVKIKIDKRLMRDLLQ